MVYNIYLSYFEFIKMDNTTNLSLSNFQTSVIIMRQTNNGYHGNA